LPAQYKVAIAMATPYGTRVVLGWRTFNRACGRNPESM